jgi:hypothetical protein
MATIILFLKEQRARSRYSLIAPNLKQGEVPWRRSR